MIVGYSGNRAFLSDGKSAWDLNTLIDPNHDFLLTSATDINNLGQIVGLAFDNRDNTYDYYLLTPTPTPEPSTLLLVAQGGLLYYWRRRAGRR
jgi:PEP-CTERM motif